MTSKTVDKTIKMGTIIRDYSVGKLKGER